MAKAKARKKRSKKSEPKKSWLTKSQDKLKEWWNNSLSAWADWTLTAVDKLYWW